MYGAAVAAHINQNMAAHNLSAKEVASRSQTPESTLSNYRTGKVEKPNEEQVLRIFAVWGDGPDVLYRIRRQAEEMASEEARLKASAKDKELIDQIAEVIKSGSIALLDQQAERMGAQQGEILKHADARIEDERRRASELNAKVLQQCKAEVERAKSDCAREIEIEKAHCKEKLDLMERMYESRIADLKSHSEQLHNADVEHKGDITARVSFNRDFLLSCVRNLTATSILLGMTTLFFGSYAIFSYTVFDMADPTRGLHRESHSIGPVALAASLALIAIAVSRLLILFLNRPKKKEFPS